MLIAALAALAAQPAILEPVDCARFTKVTAGVSAECGFLRVPESRARRGSRTIGVPYVIVHPAARAHADAVVMMSGGPGNSAIPATIRPVAADFGGRDLVFLDQRGTKHADPRLDCAPYTAAKQRAQRGEIDGPALEQALVAAATQCVREARSGGAALEGYSSLEMATDLEAFRALKGWPALNLVSLSYSGRLASVYAREFPSRTRAVVANTPLTIEANYDEQGNTAMRRTLDRVFAQCAGDAACNAAYPDLDRKFRDIVACAARSPWRLTDGTVPVTATPWVVANALADQLYDPSTFATLPSRVDAIWRGDRGALASIVDVSPSSYPWLMRMAVWCNEEAPFEKETTVRAQALRYPEFGGVDQATVPAGLCTAAGLGRRASPRENQPLRTQVPFLILSGAFDPATPTEFQQAMVRTLPNATLAVFPWRGHGAGFNKCGGELVKQFLANPSATPDTSCVRKEPRPDFAASWKEKP